jgi:SAM-dependent methyltransferase
MADCAPTPFDKIASNYAGLWDNTNVGRLQRDAVWRYVSRYFHAGDTILDLGCGAGDDALRFALKGIKVVGIDESSAMVGIARMRGVDARVCSIEDAGSLRTGFDGAISNFGALNCVADLGALREPLSQLIAPGGYLALCVMTRFCLWETFWYLLHGDLRRAVRRWQGSAQSSLGLKVHYPGAKAIVRAFAPAFTLVETAGIGILVPPSFVHNLSGELLRRLDRIDRRIASWFAAIGDHRILVFRRA